MLATLHPGNEGETSSIMYVHRGEMTASTIRGCDTVSAGAFFPCRFSGATKRTGLTYSFAYGGASLDLGALLSGPSPTRVSLLLDKF
jgi:hypothetical protein